MPEGNRKKLKKELFAASLLPAPSARQHPFRQPCPRPTRREETQHHGSGAYINPETNEVILKATSRYDKDEHYSSIRSCLESQKLRVGPYDCSRDKEIRREQIHSGEYNYANEEQYIYSPSLSRGLSIKYSGAYLNPETGEILLKATSRYDEDEHYSSAKNCRESQKLRVGPYDCSRDREIRKEQIMDGEYNGRGAVRDVIRGIGEIIRSRRGR